MKKIAKKSIFLMIFMLVALFFSALLFSSCGKTIPIEKVEFVNTFSKMYVGQSRKIGYKIYPEDANDYNITIETSNKKIVGIDREGFAIATGKGVATITMTETKTNTVLSFDVEVGDGDVYSISYDFSSFKLYYYEGENIDLSKLIVYRNFESGKMEQIPKEEYTVDCPPVAEIGTKVIITYTYEERKFVKEVELPVIEDEIDNITVTSPPAKTTYNYGEVFDNQGLKLSAKMKSGRVLEVDDYTFDTSPIDVGQTEIKIYYQDFVTNVNIVSQAEFEVSTLGDLQKAIDDGAKSIKFNGKHSIVNPIVLENISDLIIVGGDGCEITGNGIVPIKLAGDCSNIRIINIEFKLTNNKNDYCIDVDNLSSGDISFENCKFSSPSQEQVATQQIEGLIFKNCQFLSGN